MTGLEASQALANNCDYFREYFPVVYEMACVRGGRAAKPDVTSSTFASAFNLNPASLPTGPSPYGLETIGSYIRQPNAQWAPSFSIVKGFRKIGTGVSTAGNQTFYGNDIIQRAVGSPNIGTFGMEEPKSPFPNLNIGTSIPLRRSAEKVSYSLGLSLRYNHVTNTMGWGTGLASKWKWLSLGLGVSNEKVSNYLPRVYFLSGMVGARVWLFELEYVALKNLGGLVLEPIHIGTSTFSLGPVMLTGAVRYAEYLRYGYVFQRHYAVQYQVSKRFALGVLHNYIPGTNSVACQVFL